MYVHIYPCVYMHIFIYKVKSGILIFFLTNKVHFTPKWDFFITDYLKRLVTEPGLVNLGCCSKVPLTGWFINNRILFLTFLEARCPRSGCQDGWIRVLFWVKDFLLCPHMVKWGKGISAVSFVKSTNPMHESSTLMI